VPVGIMSALQDEIQVLVDRMTGIEPRHALGREFYSGELEGQKIVVVGSGVGKVRASACAQSLID
jgi:adenosylhomocysteine nucleosidase